MVAYLEIGGKIANNYVFVINTLRFTILVYWCSMNLFPIITGILNRSNQEEKFLSFAEILSCVLGSYFI